METERKCNERNCVNGTYVSPGFTGVDGHVFPETRRQCSTCQGRGEMPQPDWSAIFEAVTTKRGAEKGNRKFRASPPEAWKQSSLGIANRRAYYVWRLTRFHGGADVTMPISAMTYAGKDAWLPELEYYASQLAKKVYGTDLAAAHRWFNALGGQLNVKGLPTSAYSGGPVHDDNKPSFESQEAK